MCKVRSIATREEQSTPPRLKQAPTMKTQEGENLLKMRSRIKMRMKGLVRMRMRMKMMVRTGMKVRMRMKIMVRMAATIEMRVRWQKEGMTVVVSS